MEENISAEESKISPHFMTLKAFVKDDLLTFYGMN